MSVNNLIASLSKAEKRYFKLYSRLNSKNSVPKYVNLFDVIDKKHDITDSKLKSLGYNPVDKNFLGNKILESLQFAQTNLNPEQKVLQKLGYLNFLYEKELFSDLQKHLKQIKKICDKNDLLELRLILLDWEKKLPKSNFADKDYYKEVVNLEKIVLEQLSYKKYLLNLKERINDIIFKDVNLSKPENRAVFDEIFEAHTIPDITKITSIETLLTYHYIKSTYYIFQKNQKKAMEHSAKLVALFEQYDNFKEKHWVWYKKSLCKHLESCFRVQDWKDFPKTLDKIENLKNNSETEIFKTVVFYALLYNIQMGLLDQAEIIVDDIEINWEKHESDIQDHRQLAIFYNSAILFFIREEWDETLKWIEKITGFPRTNVRKDIQLTTRIIQLVIAYELDPTEIDKPIQTAYKYLTRNNHYFEFEESLIGLFRTLEKNVALPNIKDVFVEFKKNLKEVQQLGFDEVGLWIDSKITGKSMEQTYLEWLNKK